MITTMDPETCQTDDGSCEATCERQLGALLEDLSQVQAQLLDVLARKRECMATGNLLAMQDMQPEEEALASRLQEFQNRRAELLAAASDQGLRANNLGELATAMRQGRGGELRKQVKDATSRMRLLQHQSLTNWVIAQKSLLHLSQMLEIIATGGRLKPTYGKDHSGHAGGVLVDREV
jgi:flagellar biosynthesis/type III secretory pathway chaperone